MLETVLFDLDGTVTEPWDGIRGGVLYALKKMGRAPLSDEVLRTFIGPPLTTSFAAQCNMTQAETEQAVVYYREYYNAEGWLQNTVYDGIRPLLEELRSYGLRIGLATSKPEYFARRILDHFGLTERFDFLCGAIPARNISEKEEVLRYVIETRHPDLAKTVLIGDTKFDIIGAKAVGISSIGVLYGYGSRAEMEAYGADVILETVADLRAYFRRLFVQQ